MEHEASYRDQVAYACSAQNPKMLPKKKNPQQSKETKQKLISQASAFQQAYEAQNK